MPRPRRPRDQAPPSRAALPAERRAAVADLRDRGGTQRADPHPRRSRAAADRRGTAEARRVAPRLAADRRPRRDRRPRQPRCVLRREARCLLRHLRLERRRPARLPPSRAAGAGRLRIGLPVRSPAELALARAPHCADRRLHEREVRNMLAGNAHRIADGEEPLEPSEPHGRATFSQPMVLARIHQYLSMATPLLWTRQPDTIGVLGLALNACEERNGHPRRLDQIRELLITARELWRGLPSRRPRTTACAASRTVFRLIHLADILAVTTDAELTVNGAATTSTPAVGRTLAETLREDLGLTGTKVACDEGHCGACTVLLDGVPTLSCITLVHTVGERDVTTIEGLRDHPLVDAFVRTDALQCGFCTPGQIVSAVGARRGEPRPDASSEIRHRMAGNLCRCGDVSEDRGGDRSRGATDPDREGGRGPLHRGRVARRRGGRARPVARRARSRSSAGRRREVDGHERARGEARYTADMQLPGMLHTAVLRSPHAHATRDAHRRRPREGGPGRARRARGRRHRVAVERARLRGPAGRGRRRGHDAQARAAVELIEVEWDVLEPLLDPEEAVAARARSSGRRAATSAATRARPRRGGRRRRGRVPHADACIHNSLETHQAVCDWSGDGARRLHLDAVHLGRPQRGRRGVRAAAPTRCASSASTWAAASARRATPATTRFVAAELARRTGRPVRCAMNRREENIDRRQPQRDDPARHRGRAFGRHAHRARRRVLLRGRLGRLAAVDRRPDADAHACENVRTVEYGAKLNIPPMAAFRAPGFVEGTFGARVPARQARSQARPRPARAASPQPRERRHDGRPAVLVEEPDGVLPPRRAALGAPHGSARALGRDVEARRRAREPDLVRRRRPAVVRVGARRLRRPRERRHRDAGHRHGHAHRDGADRRRGARAPARPRRGRRSATPRAGRTRRSPAARRRCRRWAPPCARPRPTRRGRSSRSPRSASTSRSACSRSRAATSSASDGGSWPLEEVTGLLQDGQILGKGARGPNPAGMRVLTFGVQVAEVAVDVETGEVRRRARSHAIHDVGRVINPLGARSQVEGGIIQAIGHTLSEERLDDPRPARSSRARSTRTSCRRSPTFRRSSASSSTCRTST